MTLTWVQDKLLELTRKYPSQDESKLKLPFKYDYMELIQDMS